MAKEINGLCKFKSAGTIRKAPVYICARTLDEAKHVLVLSLMDLGVKVDDKMLNLEQVEFSERASQ